MSTRLIVAAQQAALQERQAVDAQIMTPEVPEEFRSHITTTASYTLGAYLVAIGVFSLLMNGLSLAILFRGESKDVRNRDLLIVNISISDICLVLTTFPFAISSLFAERWLFYKAGCVAYGFTSFLFGLQNLMSMVLYAATRYMAVCHPFTGLLLRRRTIVAAMAATFGYCVLWSALPLGAWGSYGPEPYGTACSINWTRSDNMPYIMTIFVVIFCLPVLANVYCYSRVALYAHRSARILQASRCRVIRGKRVQRNGGRNNCITTRGVLLSASFIACWSPYAIVSFWAAFGDVGRLPLLATAFPATMCKTSVLLNPILYLCTNRRFVTAVKRRMSMKKLNQRNSLDSSEH